MSVHSWLYSQGSYCNYRGCSNRWVHENDQVGLEIPITFHSFPDNPKHFESWREASGLPEGWKVESCKNKAHLCSEHFREEDLVRNKSGVSVRENAVPIQWTPETVLNNTLFKTKLKLCAELESRLRADPQIMKTFPEKKFAPFMFSPLKKQVTKSQENKSVHSQSTIKLHVSPETQLQPLSSPGQVESTIAELKNQTDTPKINTQMHATTTKSLIKINIPTEISIDEAKKSFSKPVISHLEETRVSCEMNTEIDSKDSDSKNISIKNYPMKTKKEDYSEKIQNIKIKNFITNEISKQLLKRRLQSKFKSPVKKRILYNYIKPLTETEIVPVPISTMEENSHVENASNNQQKNIVVTSPLKNLDYDCNKGELKSNIDKEKITTSLETDKIFEQTENKDVSESSNIDTTKTQEVLIDPSSESSNIKNKVPMTITNPSLTEGSCSILKKSQQFKKCIRDNKNNYYVEYITWKAKTQQMEMKYEALREKYERNQKLLLTTRKRCQYYEKRNVKLTEDNKKLAQTVKNPTVTAAELLSKDLPACMKQLFFKVAHCKSKKQLPCPPELREFLVKLRYSTGKKAYKLLKQNLNNCLPDLASVSLWKQFQDARNELQMQEKRPDDKPPLETTIIDAERKSEAKIKSIATQTECIPVIIWKTSNTETND